MPKDKNQKLVFLAGGIGITPFRSMIKYLLDTKQKRDIVLFYTTKTPNEFVYRDIFYKASTELEIKVIYTITDIDISYPSWPGEKGRISEKMIGKHVPDYNERIFYFSGPQSMIKGFEKTLKEMGIPKRQMKQDFFPGYI